MASRTRLARWARWSVVATTVCGSAALLWTTYTGRRSIYEASYLIARGEAGAFSQALFDLDANAGGEPSSSELRAFIEQESARGLRYAAFRARDGEIVAEAGTAINPSELDVDDDPKAAMVRQGDRVRVVVPRQRRHGLSGLDRHRRLLHLLTSDPWRRLVHRRPTLTFEFEPIVANRLERDADRALATSFVTAGLLLVAASALWHVLGRREREQIAAGRENQLARLGTMSAVIAHEIRNPLASLKGHAQLLAERLEPGSPQRRKAERVVSEATRIEDLSATLLEFLRSGSADRTELDPKDVVRRAVEAVDAQRIRVDVARAPHTWSLDPQRIEQALANLLRNAIQASPRDAFVDLDVAVDERDDALLMVVRDHGTGIPERDRERVFEAFHTTHAQGVGLGLAIARRIVERHGGTLEAGNHPDGGAMFQVRIPR